VRRLHRPGSVCGKTAAVANAQDDLTRALIGLSLDLAGQTPSDEQRRVMLEGLFTTVTNVSFDGVRVAALTSRVNALRTGASGTDCAASGEPLRLWTEDEDVRSLKSLILFGLRGMAAYAYHARMLGYLDEQVDAFFFEGLRAGGDREAGMEELLPVVHEGGRDQPEVHGPAGPGQHRELRHPHAHHGASDRGEGPLYRGDRPRSEGPELLLEQTRDKGIHVYTHGEMLPAHAYPRLHAYPHLKGNFGTAWQNQQKEFADLPAPILFTTTA
jgi:hydroxylamine reductase